MTEKEIALETFEYYKTHPFGYNGRCVYSSPDGEKKCAVGRCIDPDLLSKLTETSIDSLSLFLRAKEFEDDVLGLSYFLHEQGLDLDSILYPQYRGQQISFWSDMQDWHDGSANRFMKERCQDIEMKYRGWEQ
jgi:hypothetical protein